MLMLSNIYIYILSLYQAAPQDGHLEQILRIFSNLKKKNKLSLYSDYIWPKIDYYSFRTKQD